MTIRALTLAAVCALTVVVPARSDLIFTSTGGTATDGQDYTYGFRFTPMVDITVDSLGFFDADRDGLAVGHRVGIWDLSGTTLLTSTTVTTANSTLGGPVFNDGQFRFTTISGLNLSAGVTYLFGASIELASDTWYFGGQNIAAAPSLATVSSDGYFKSGLFVAPTNSVGNTYAAGSFTATARSVPEPSSGVLAGLGMTVLGFAGRTVQRRRRDRRG